MKQGWNKSGHIKGDALEPFLGSGGPLKDPRRAPNCPKSPFGAITRTGVSKLVEQYETRVEQVRAHPG